MNLLWKLFWCFVRIGAFTFGGGWAMIVLIEREIVDRHGWMSREEFLNSLALVQALPGVIAVNIAASLGYKLRGLRGAVVASIGALLPSFLIILAIAIFLSPSFIKENATLSAIFKGIRPCVVALIVAPVLTSAKAAGINRRTVAIPVAVALLVWSRITFISNPILFIVLAIVVGWLWQAYTSRKEGAAS